MWFGNLVTMKFWDDLWLNESFATFMSHLALDKVILSSLIFLNNKFVILFFSTEFSAFKVELFLKLLIEAVIGKKTVLLKKLAFSNRLSFPPSNNNIEIAR